jgi:hypothetical protein
LTRVDKLIIFIKCFMLTVNNRSESPVLLDIGARGGIT